MDALNLRGSPRFGNFGHLGMIANKKSITFFRTSRPDQFSSNRSQYEIFRNILVYIHVLAITTKCATFDINTIHGALHIVEKGGKEYDVFCLEGNCKRRLLHEYS